MTFTLILALPVVGDYQLPGPLAEQIYLYANFSRLANNFNPHCGGHETRSLHEQSVCPPGASVSADSGDRQPLSRGSSRRLSPTEKREICDRYLAGGSLAVVAKAACRAESTVQSVLAEAGIARRPPGVH